MKRFFIVIIISLSGIRSLVAQYDAQLSNQWAAINYYNPAYAGATDNLELTGLFRQQWLGIDGAPRTAFVVGQMPISLMGKTHGIGAIGFTEKIGLFSHTIVSGQYAWKKNIGKGVLSIGIQGGYISESFKGSEIDFVPPEGDEYHEQEDPAIPGSDISGGAIDAAFGLMFSRPKWYVGLSVTHLTSPQLQLDENTIMEVPRAYYFTAGYNIPLNNPLLELRPALLVKTTSMSPYAEVDSIVAELAENSTAKAMMTMMQVDLSVRMIYNKTFWGGLGWRKGDAAMLSFGGKFKGIEAGYAYDFPISAILKGSTGSHELFIKYIVDLSKKKNNRYRHKSVRIL